MKPGKLICVLALFAFVFCAPQICADPDATWTQPFPPFRIAGNLYYVGSGDLASYLIATPKGLILINSNLTSSPPLIRKSVEVLGFRFSDIKILLISHAHDDHCAGSAEIIRETGAKYFVMAGDVAVVQSGGKSDFAYGAKKDMQYPLAACRSRAARWRHHPVGRHSAYRASDRRAYPRHHYLDDGRDRGRTLDACGDRGQPKRESGIQAGKE